MRRRADAWIPLIRVRLHVCGCVPLVPGDVAGSRAAFVEVTSDTPGSGSSTAWLQFASFELRHGDSPVAAARRVFESGLASPTLSDTARDELWRRYIVRGCWRADCGWRAVNGTHV